MKFEEFSKIKFLSDTNIRYIYETKVMKNQNIFSL